MPHYRAALSLTRQTFNQLDLEMPPKVAKAFADLETIRDRAAADLPAVPPSSVRLGAAIADALREGRDPVTDDGVRQLLAVGEFARSRGADAVGAYIEATFDELFATHIDDLFAVMAPAVAADDEILVAARDEIPDLDLQSTDRIGQYTPRQLSTWGHARESVARLERIAKVWAVLSAAAGAPVPQHRRPLILAELDTAQLSALGHQPQAIAAVHAGHRLSLATREEFNRRCDALVSEIQDQGTAQARASKNVWSNSVRMGALPAA